MMLRSGSLEMDALILVAVLSAIPLSVSLCVGLLSSVLQAATQIQEQTLSFIPKLAAVVLTLAVFGPWMWGEIVDFGREVLMARSYPHSAP